MVGGRRPPTLMSPIRAVPPAIGIASGRSAFSPRASSRECGNRTSMTVRLLYPRGGRAHASQQRACAEDKVVIRGGLQWRMADPADARDEQHARGNMTGEDGGIVSRH